MSTWLQIFNYYKATCNKVSQTAATHAHTLKHTQTQRMHISICGLLGKAVHFLEINTSAPQKGTEQLENLCRHYLKGLLSTLSLSPSLFSTDTHKHTIKTLTLQNLLT